jgi:endoglucanase
LALAFTAQGTAKPLKTVVLGKSTTSGVAAPAMPGENVPAIKVNTVGYPSDWAKIVVFNVDPAGARVLNRDGGIVMQITAENITNYGEDKASKDPVWQVDITAVRSPGTYTIAVGDYRSDAFVVGDGLYDKALLAGLKSFYFQRTRTALVAPYATWEGESYLRKGVSHAHKDVGWDLNDHPAKKNKWNIEKGWHDAGNFDMYVPSTAPTSQSLLIAYEWAPERFDDHSDNIPESGNGIPDILDEVKWGLDWILSLQQDDGAFRHRESVMEWSPEGPADEDKTVRWVAGISTAGTAKAVAVLAKASGTYAKHDSAYAKKCELAAKKGWKYLQDNPERVRSSNHGTGQPLWDDEPGMTDTGARFVMAVEYWKRFQDPTALKMIQSLMSEPETQPDAFLAASWANLSNWGISALALDDRTPSKLKSEARKRILTAADILVERAGTDGYLCASRPEDYYWGHNSILMEKVHILAVAAKLDPAKTAYMTAARDQWHWILGRNPNGYSMTTGVGKGPTRFYHMEWGTYEPPPPGFLIGGPNGQNMDFLAPGIPAKALLWENPGPLRSGVPEGSLWHWHQSDLWDGKFVAEGQYSDGWWAVIEPDILYSADFVLAAVSVQ